MTTMAAVIAVHLVRMLNDGWLIISKYPIYLMIVLFRFIMVQEEVVIHARLIMMLSDGLRLGGKDTSKLVMVYCGAKNGWS